ncbi:Ltp family lipoprotein [Acetobacterium wieringae]|nr:Ltp family lipoprotein [Acetobacterium wieringae]
MEENVKVPFWQKTWVVVLACIFIPPAGLALLWVGKKGGMVLRIILTIILGFYSLAWLSGFVGGSKSDVNSDQTAIKTEVVAEDTSATDKAAADKVASDKAAADKAASDKAAADKAAADKAAADKAAADKTAAEAAKPQLTIGQKNALSKAKSYLDFTAFSHSGLIAQLEYEGYSTEDSSYAADNCGADWNEQAAKKAKSYLDFSSFSRDGLIDQLLYEGYTSDQAEYGVTQVGY